MNRYQQAVQGIQVREKNGIVRVQDGQDQWFCGAANWNDMQRELEGDEAFDGDEGHVDAYAELCRRVQGPIASVIGVCRGEYADLVAQAVAAGLIEPSEARRLYGVDA